MIVFDGTHPYEALLGALGGDSTAVWCRRPLWKRGSSRVPLGREGAFDAVLEPGELAESEDAGPTVALRDRAHRVGPIVLLDPSQLLARDEAAAELGLDPGRPTILVSLGQGPRCARRPAARSPVWRRARSRSRRCSSALAAAEEVPAGVVALSATYPMSRYFAAFDGAVAAAGYNAYHELIALGVPSLFVPMPRDTDDQPARARYAERAGIGLGVTGPRRPRARGEARADARPGRARRDPRPPRRPRARPRARRRPRPGWPARHHRRRPASGQNVAVVKRNPPVAGRARSFGGAGGRSSPACRDTAVRLTRQQLTQPRARALVFAVGVPADDVVDAVAGGHRRGRASRRRRTLVVTDALGRSAPCGRWGRGSSTCRRAGSRQAELAGGTYDDFVRRRLELIRAERPRPRAVVVGPGWNADPFGTLRALRWRPPPP